MATNNTLGAFNPIFYAQEALIALEKALGMASRVHMGYDEERRTFGKGETINIKRPATFSVADAPATAQDLITGTTPVVLDQWREVKFSLTDKELAFADARIIADHIRPAAYALADDIDGNLCALAQDVGNFSALTGTLAVGDLTAARLALFNQKAPLHDAGNIHLMVDGEAEAELLNLTAFNIHNGAGQDGVETQRRGTIGTKFGMEVFANQNVITCVAGTGTYGIGTIADTAGTVDGAHAKGATSVAIQLIGTTDTLMKGSAILIGTTTYAITATVSMAAGAGTVVLDRPLVAAAADNDPITLTIQVAGEQCLAFHRSAFALATAPLSEMGNQLGANIATVHDPITGLSLRSRVYYVGNSSEVHVALDVLYGVKTLDGQLAYRMVH